MSANVPIYKEKGRTYHADSCDPLVAASEKGEVVLEALSRGTYPGERMPKGALKGVRSVGFWDATKKQNWGLPWHRNEGIEFTLLETGSTPFSLENKSSTLNPGDMTITRPWQPHKVGNPNIGIGKLHWLIIDVGVRQPHQEWKWPSWLILTRDDLEELTQNLRENEQPVWEASADIKRCFQQMAETVIAHQAGNSISRLAVYINELLLVMLEMFRQQKVQLTKSLTSARRSTELFLRALKVNPSEQWTLESMAESCGLGVTRFVHYCKQITNQTPMQYLNQVRVEKAAKILKQDPDKSVTQVSFECGFTTSQYFATVFRKAFSCTPKEYRRKME